MKQVGTTPAGASGLSRRVLVIEDNVAGREMLCLLLQLWGHQVEAAEDGLRGVKMALGWQPDVAVVDIGLPLLDGYQVARQVREALGAAVRLIALTSYGRPEDKALAYQAGYDVHLTKPAEPEELRRVVAGGPGRGGPPPGPFG